MSTHCQYVVFPDDGRDPYVVENHPYPHHVSDDLGGAIPLAIPLTAAMAAMWVREDAVTTGRHLNQLASVMVALLAEGRPTVVFGPSVLTRIELTDSSPGGFAVAAEGFRGAIAAGLVRIAVDISAALDGYDGPFEATTTLSPGWPARVRRLAQKLAAEPVSVDWPQAEGRTAPYDHVSAGLERHFTGRRFLPYPPLPTRP